MLVHQRPRNEFSTETCPPVPLITVTRSDGGSVYRQPHRGGHHPQRQGRQRQDQLLHAQPRRVQPGRRLEVLK